MRRQIARFVYLVLLVPAVIGTPVLLAMAWEYYLTQHDQQPFLQGHDTLRSSGDIGLTLGIVGTALMLLNLLYILRRRKLHWNWAGSLRAWINLHVTTGLLAAVAILFHSAMTLRSAPATVAASALFVVVLTGLIGRYIYSRVPRSIEGRELRQDEIRNRLREMHNELSSMGVDVRELGGHIEDEKPGEGTLWGAVRSLVSGVQREKTRFRETQRIVQLRKLNDNERKHMNHLLRRLARERTWQERYNAMRTLMSSWRFFHLWMAIVLICAALGHIVIALIYAVPMWLWGGGV